MTSTAVAEDIVDIAAQVAAAGHDVPSPGVLKRACDQDALCAARFIRDRIGDGAAIVPAEPKDKKSGWTKSAPLHHVSVGTDGRMIIAPRRFDERAIVAALARARGSGEVFSTLVIDLRKLDKADSTDNMRRTAALFTGMQDRAFQLTYATGRAVDWTVPKPQRKVDGFRLEVWTDHEIDADAETFAALLRKFANARIFGEDSRAKGYLKTTVPVTHGWALEIPTGRISVPGVDLTGGLLVDGRVPE
ncbi:MAG: hypothetical protein JJ855_15760 [Rhodospirillales bacterium]|nr:hypothetical protein [Rhodospirillales bacterium]